MHFCIFLGCCSLLSFVASVVSSSSPGKAAPSIEEYFDGILQNENSYAQSYDKLSLALFTGFRFNTTRCACLIESAQTSPTLLLLSMRSLWRNLLTGTLFELLRQCKYEIWKDLQNTLNEELSFASYALHQHYQDQNYSVHLLLYALLKRLQSLPEYAFIWDSNVSDVAS